MFSRIVGQRAKAEGKGLLALDRGKAARQMVKISACAIMKDEAANLPRWLKAMQGLADEMIIVDTGSQDATRSIAQQAGAKVYEQQWQDDFALAKNYALTKAAGEWIIFLDADEYFSEASKARLRQTLANFSNRRGCDVFMCPLLNLDRHMNVMNKETAYIVRIFRNLPELRYQGKIHEQLYYQGKEVTDFKVLLDVKILHTGYDESCIEAKLRRNLKLLLQEIAAHPKEAAKYYAATAECYYGLQDYAEAARYSMAFIDSGYRAIGDMASVYRTAIAALEASGAAKAVLRRYIQKGSELFPQDSFLQVARQKYLAAPPTATACVIVKNEATNLPNWFKYIRPFVEEIVVVD